MDYNKLEYYSSKPRLDRFLTACGNSKSKAQNLYKINLQVSQAFYPVLNLFEIFLRNALNYRMAAYFADPDWIVHQKNAFMNNLSLAGTKYFLRSSVVKAENAILRKGGVVSSGKIIAEQTLGFWTGLFDVHHYRLIGGTVIHAFPGKPRYVNRSLLSKKLNRTREFRNRIYHNEPICFAGPVIDFAHAEIIRLEIYELLSWMDVGLSDYIMAFDAVIAQTDQARYL